MSDKPLISVIIPVYNSAAYLDACLDSVCKQTYRNIEIITINDGSFDTSEEILKQRANLDSRLRIINQENMGVSAARNRGIAECRGEIVCFVDSDDIIWDGMIEELLQFMKEFDPDIACGLLCSEIKDLGRKADDVKELLSGEDFTEGILYQTSRRIVSPCGQLIKKKLFNQENLFRVDIRYEDLELIPRLYMKSERVGLVSRNVYYYQQHSSSFIHTFSPHRFDSLKAVESLRHHLSSLSQRISRAVDDRILSASFNAFLLSAGRKDYIQINDQCWKNIVKLRKDSLFNPKVRLKNKAGILLSYTGRSCLTLIGKLLGN